MGMAFLNHSAYLHAQQFTNH